MWKELAKSLLGVNVMEEVSCNPHGRSIMQEGHKTCKQTFVRLKF